MMGIKNQLNWYECGTLAHVAHLKIEADLCDEWRKYWPASGASILTDWTKFGSYECGDGWDNIVRAAVSESHDIQSINLQYFVWLWNEQMRMARRYMDIPKDWIASVDLVRNYNVMVIRCHKHKRSNPLL